MVFSVQGDKISSSQLSYYLTKIAQSEKKENILSALDIDIPVVSNILQAEILKSDDKKLISLFHRAVNNYNTLFPDKKAETVMTFNKHFQNPLFQIPKTDLTIDVREEKVIVTTKLQVQNDNDATQLILHGQEQNLQDVWINGTKLYRDEYRVTPNELIILFIPDQKTFEVTVKSEIDPFNNTSGEGLYKSSDFLTTQCESEGARKIFYTIDQPSVLSKYTTTIIADFFKYPARISNGNLISEKIGVDGRATIIWDDPFPKPSYLFATVLGNFGMLKDTFTTRSGREVKLEVYMEQGKEKRAKFSLWALKKAMHFDEKYFDREYDLDSLKMVAIPDFNMGAMENKGLMIFNEPSLLANDKCSTDSDYTCIASTISHEYFHNWSGNRVTVRNWFELALKEAFTEFRSVLFKEWMYGQELVRPESVRSLREGQFPQDAGPGAHPIQLESYANSDSIYDKTTYIKGPEVFRIMKTILDGKEPELFRKAQNMYFERYDGQAVTFRELISTLEEVSGIDLKQFERWFTQAGTPTVKIKMDYDELNKRATLFVKQTCKNPKTKEEQPPFHIPFSLELLKPNGSVAYEQHQVELTDREHSFIFANVDQKPTPVFHHGFSAPVKVEYDYSNEDLINIIYHESDPFCRWEAGQSYGKRVLKNLYQQIKENGNAKVPKSVIREYRKALKSKYLTPLDKKQLLTLPSSRVIVEGEEEYDFIAATKARRTLHKAIGKKLVKTLPELLEKHPAPENYRPMSDTFSDEMKTRSLRNICLSFLADGPYIDKVVDQFNTAKNYNDRYAALCILANSEDPRKEEALKKFQEEWKDDLTIFNNWITLQTTANNCTIDTLEKVRNTEGVDQNNANHMRSLYRAFVNNYGCYHDEKGEGYRYITDRILEFADLNPQVIANYVAEPAFIDFKKLPAKQQALMRTQLERLTNEKVHKDVRAVANKYLKRV